MHDMTCGYQSLVKLLWHTPWFTFLLVKVDQSIGGSILLAKVGATLCVSILLVKVDASISVYMLLSTLMLQLVGT